ncbi:hypothetical protein RQP46_009584 [Phenoliferia psychrophenolica]
MGSTPEWRVKSMHRTWLICLMVEKTMAVSMGKPSLLWSHGVVQVDLEEDALDSLEDLMRSLTSMDNHLPDTDALFQRQLENWRERGEKRERARDVLLSEEQKAIQRARYNLYFGYAQLILASVGLQHSLEVDSTYAPFALAKLQTAALAVLHTFRDDWAATGFSTYCTDFQYAYICYAAVSLLKSVQPQFGQHSMLDKGGLGLLIHKTADLLEDAARTWDHIPFLHSKFMRRVLRARLPEFSAPPRVGPLPARLVTPEEMATKELGPPDLAFPQSAVDATDMGDIWMQNDFTDTTFGRSELFSWDDYVYN